MMTFFTRSSFRMGPHRRTGRPCCVPAADPRRR